MTPKETAAAIQRKAGINGWSQSGLSGALAQWIEEAIKEAIEEEREACALIAKIRREKEREHYSRYKEGTQPGFIIAEEIELGIRARSESKGD